MLEDAEMGTVRTLPLAVTMEGLDFTTYQMKARETGICPAIGGSEIYPCLGLASEVGELMGKVKKIYRDHKGQYTTEDLDAIASEVGDCMWYLATIATELGISLEGCARGNLEKLASRKARGVLGGSGDNR